MFTSIGVTLNQTVSYNYPISFTTCWNAVCSTNVLGLLSRVKSESTSGIIDIAKIGGSGTETNVSLIIIGY